MSLPRQPAAPLSALVAGLEGPIVFLSPHYDDVAFSCAGTVVELVESGYEVHLVTLFSAGLRPPRGFALECQTSKGIAAEEDYMAVRGREDAGFARLVGIAARHTLDLLEAPHRGYDSSAALFGPELDGDGETERLAARRLADLISALRPAAVWAPMGVGGHVDHRIAQRIAQQLSTLPEPAPELLWYPEQPYFLRQLGDAVASSFAAEAGGRWVFCDIQQRFEVKAAAVSCYASQLEFQLRDVGEAGDLGRQAGLACARVIGHNRPIEIVLWNPRSGRHVGASGASGALWGTAREESA